MSSRPPVFTWNEELHFGPSSEQINIRSFANDAQNLQSRGLLPWLDSLPTKNGEASTCEIIAGWNEWQQLPEEVRASVETDCDLSDLAASLSETLSSQKRMHYLQNVHADAISQFGVGQPRKKNKRKGKEHAEHVDPDMAEFRSIVAHTPLNNWKVNVAARPYVRGGHVSDQNALDSPKISSSLKDKAPCSHEVLFTLTTYTRNSWYPYTFSRDSKHTLLSSNTLADVWSCVPCTRKGSRGLPREIISPDTDVSGDYVRRGQGGVVGYETGNNESDLDQVVIVIEGVAYCDGHGPFDYADKLLFHLEQRKQTSPSPNAPRHLPLGPYERPRSTIQIQKGPPLDAMKLHGLTLRINEPYWMFHRGCCEHWIVVDEIRLQNPQDPTSGYPIALQRTPAFRPLCRICSKIPATLSVLHDIRLGESPSLLCQPCWELFGGPPQAEGDSLTEPVVVVPVIFET